MKGKEIIHVTNIHVTILREWLRPSVLFYRTNIIHMPTSVARRLDTLL
jgi:hypothetical protein